MEIKEVLNNEVDLERDWLRKLFARLKWKDGQMGMKKYCM
jgi:hypothetical protein